MATILNLDGYEITIGLQGSSVCDEAIHAASRIAVSLGEPVILADDDGDWEVSPDGEVSPAGSECEECGLPRESTEERRCGWDEYDQPVLRLLCDECVRKA